ncbi:hypothetical protein FOZ61_002253 [Perkinsus olseni]|uniref:Tyr recombinase domain-containing protein n=1 Tax=Perkinsus olseni TaxID=32597 RepID=A0A7J6KQ79_PEROL|nr:hypothetical protein FOZ61_002253 [Perkinsus olseni]
MAPKRKAPSGAGLEEQFRTYQELSVEDRERAREVVGTIDQGNPLTVNKMLDVIIVLSSGGSIGPSTLRSYVSAIKTCAVIRTGKVLSKEESELIDRGIKGGCNQLAHKNKETKKAGILPPEAIRSLAGMTLGAGTVASEMRDAIVTGCCLVLRFDNLAPIRKSDVTWTREAGGLLVTVSLGRTKTGENEMREVACQEDLTCGKSFCVAHRLRQRAIGGPPDALVFPIVGRMTTDSFGTAFRSWMTKWFPMHLKDWGVSSLSAHSLRRSGSSALVDLGVEDSLVKAAGGWAPTSRVWEGYTTAALRRKTRSHSDLLLSGEVTITP